MFLQNDCMKEFIGLLEKGKNIKPLTLDFHVKGCNASYD